MRAMGSVLLEPVRGRSVPPVPPAAAGADMVTSVLTVSGRPSAPVPLASIMWVPVATLGTEAVSDATPEALAADDPRTMGAENIVKVTEVPAMNVRAVRVRSWPATTVVSSATTLLPGGG